MSNPRISYRENDIRGATATTLVVLLYEQLIQDLSQALQAIERGDIEMRTRHLNHGILVIAHLQSPLDFANGGKVAHDLDNFYNVLRQNLVQIQFQPLKVALRQQITDLLAIREAWIEVEKATRPPAPGCSAPTATAAGRQPDSPRVDWKG
jgi:flagellar biosynthetic protein FliS